MYRETKCLHDQGQRAIQDQAKHHCMCARKKTCRRMVYKRLVEKRRKGDWQQTKKTPKKQGTKGREEWGSGKKRRQSNRGMKEKWLEGLRDGEKGEWSGSVKHQGNEEEKTEWKQLESSGEREQKRGGCHPWLPLITHSLMTPFFFFPPSLISSPWERGRRGGSSARTQSNRVE